MIAMRIARRAATVLALCLWAIPATAEDFFPDKNLETAVRGVIFDKKDPSKPLTEDDLRKVFVLHGKGKGIKDLKGLEKCTNLHELNLAKNEIESLEPLKDLKYLQSLDLSHNKVANLEPLQDLTGLQFLELSHNQIQSVEPLGKLAKLSALYISDNKIADVAPLSELVRLSSLDLAKNEVADIRAVNKLAGLSLLKLSDNKIEDISPIPKKNQIRMLFLERNKIADLSHLVAAAKEDSAGEKRFAPFLRLYLAGNPLSDAAKKDQLESLKQSGVRLEETQPKAAN